MATAHKPKPKLGKVSKPKPSKSTNVVPFKSAKAKHKRKQMKYPKAERESRLTFSKGANAIGRAQGEYSPTEKDREDVEQMCAHGLSHDSIASILKISRLTLEKHFPLELTTGTDKMLSKVAKSLYYQAINLRNVQACIYILSRRNRKVWAENPNRTLAEPERPTNMRPDYSKLSNDEIDEMRRLVAKACVNTVDVTPSAAITVDND